MTKLFGAMIAAGLMAAAAPGWCGSSKVIGVGLTGPMSAIESATTTHARPYHRLAAPTPDNFRQAPKRAAGTREDVVTRRRNTALPAQSVTYNHCGRGYVYDRRDGCQPAQAK